MTTRTCAALTLAFAAFAGPSTPLAQTTTTQSGGFLATLGNDTIHVERFAFENGAYRGTIVTRVPETRVVKYTFAPASDSKGVRYYVATYDANGEPITSNGLAGSISQRGDTLFRVSLRDGVMDTARIVAAKGAVPSPSVPYVGVTYLAYEAAFAAMRARGDSAIYQLTMIPQQTRPSASRAWLVGKDSAELDYFGVARSGYKFDETGKLLRADWRGTTYRYRISRIDAVDVDALARRWAIADARGEGIGALSPRDTARGSTNGADFTIDYSRPSKRGRDVWGTVVTVGQVWRLGADVATHFTTTKDLRIGDADVPAGSYTLWMLPTSATDAKLIINKQTKIFGTQYNAANDLARVSLVRSSSPATDRLALGIENGMLEIRWDNAAWRVPVVVK